jgi:plasmid replication initiation protein
MDKLKQMMAKIEALSTAQDKIKNKPNEAVEGRDLSENSITKSNSLARSYYRFNLVEKRVMEVLISQLNPLSKDKFQLQKLELKAIDYAKTFGVSEKNAYEQLETAVGGLMGRVFSVAIPKGREEFTLMSNAQYLEGEGKITCSFNSYITPHLVGLRGKLMPFTKYSLKMTANFKSSYTWRIYEILVSWAKDPKLTEGILAGWCTIEVNDLRQMLGVPKSYQWCHFQEQVLDVSKSELLEKANIEVEIERIKTGRKITHLKFIFAEKSPVVPNV